MSCPSASQYSSYKMYSSLSDRGGIEIIYVHRSSRFGRLQGIRCALAGRNLYMRFTCSTGDAMGMNMVSKGVENVLGYLQNDFPDMDLISLSGSILTFCYGKEKLVLHSFNKGSISFSRQLNTMSVLSPK
jgi:hydroxymethylglutaryl-CoA reductase (NADPH)